MGSLRSRADTRNHKLRLFYLSALMVFHTALAMTQQPIPAEEASPTLIHLSRTDSSVNVLLQGSWESGLSAQGGIALTEFGLQAAATNNPLLLTQKADLTLSLWIRDHWFVEASFLDNYDINTYRAGYQGGEDDPLQYVGIGNTGLDFPTFPYLDLGGSSPSSFGVYNKWQFTDRGTPKKTSRLLLHGILRYDGAKLEEKTFIGTRAVSESRLELSDMLRGYAFILPDDNLDTVPVLYIEDPSGDQVDELNGRWRLAKASEYAASARYGLLEITSAAALSAGKRLAVAYKKNGDNAPWLNSLGAYGDTSGNNGSGFLGEVQAVFNASTGVKIGLINYPQPGQKDSTKLGTDSNKPGSVKIAGTECLVIWEKGTFSPFERLSRYRLQSGTSSTVKLVKTSDGTESSDFALEPLSYVNTFNDTVQSGTSSDTVQTSASSDTYELLQTNRSYDPRDLETSWPLVNKYPELYLPGSSSTSLDLQIVATSYGSPGTLSIGTDVLPGSVQVYRNGLPDPLATFNPETGEVILGSPPSDNEQIKIVYLKRSEERRFGSLAAGIGANYSSGGPFTGDLALALRWNVSPDAFSEGTAVSPGTVGLSGKLAWNWEDLKLQSTLGFLYRQEDTTGIYRALGMEGSQYAEAFPGSGFYQSPEPVSLNESLSLSPKLTAENQAQLVYRSYTSTDLLGISTLHEIDWEGAPPVSSKTGPYLVHDSTLDTQVLVGEATYTASKDWAGFQVPMDQAASALAGARQIRIPFRFYDTPGPLGSTSVQVYLQIGALDGGTEHDQTGWENSTLVLTAKLFSSTANPAGILPTQWQSVTLTLNDADRRALAGARAMRLVVVTSGVSGQLRTRLLVGPPVVSGTSMRPIIVSGGLPQGADTDTTSQVQAVETIDPDLRDRFPDTINMLHPSGSPQRVLVVSSTNFTTAGTGAGVDTRIALPPLSNYQNISLFIRGPKAADILKQTTLQNGSLTLLIAGGLEKAAHPILRAVIPLAALAADQWSRVDIKYNSGTPLVLVDGNTVTNAVLSFDALQGLSYSETGTHQPYQYVAVFISPAEGYTLPDNSFAIDELLFTEPTASLQSRAGLFVQWEQKGPLVSVFKVPVFSDLRITSSAEGLYQVPVGSPYPASFGNLQNQSLAAFKVLGLDTELRGGFSLIANSLIWNGGHRLTIPLGPVELGDSFFINDSSYTHQSSAKIKSTKLSSQLSAQVSQESFDIQRTWKYALEGRQNRFFMASSGGLTYASSAGDLFSNWASGYSQAWMDSWESILPDLGPGVTSRTWSLQAKTGIEPKTLGLLAETGLTSRGIKNLNATEQGLRYSLSFPFSAGGVKGSIKNERETRQNSTSYGQDLEKDVLGYGTFININRDILLLAPGYSLFTPTIKDMMLKSATQQDILSKLSFSDSYSLSLQAPPPAGPGALFFPAQFQTKVSRTVNQNLSSYTDSHTWDIGLTSSAVNVFGTFGQSPLFMFYRDDEFSQELNVNLIWVDESLMEWKAGLKQRFAFYGFTGAKLEANNALTMTQAGWSDAIGVSWTYPNPNSLLGTLFTMVAASKTMQKTIPGLTELAETSAELLQKESLEAKLDMNNIQTIDINLTHESILRMKNRLAVTSFGKLIYSQSLQQNSFTLIGSTGIIIKIQF
ncbi:MAG: hypothetical protein AB1404_03545 [Spirochaetota bacterium]